MNDSQVLIIGAGFSGLSAGLRLADSGYDVLALEANKWLGGRTASWSSDGMNVESGLHRVIGTYREVPSILRLAGTSLNKITIYQDEAELRDGDGASAVYGASPHRAPLRTLKGMLGNNHYLGPLEKLAFSRFFAAGTAAMATKARKLDKVTVYDFARKHGMSDESIRKVLHPFTAGILFLPPEKFSAYVFFRLMLSFSPRSTTMRLGVYAGGMTEVIADPMANAIRRKGGEVRSATQVHRLLVENGAVTGAETSAGTIRAKQVILATSLAAAQKLLRASGVSGDWFQPMLSLPTTPAVAVQLDLDAPALPTNRITFGAGTDLACFAEQSRTTFRQEGGRLSMFLADPEKFLGMEPAAVVEHVVADARRVGLQLEGHIRDYRVVFHEHDFHCLKPGYNHLRPGQKTPMPGLTLAGDYTRHRFPATMEGAALSARRAVSVVKRALKG